IDRRQRFVGEPGIEELLRLLARIDLVPGEAALPAVRALHGAIEDVLRGAPDVWAGAVALDERDDGLIGNLEGSLAKGDGLARGGGTRQAGRGIWGHSSIIAAPPARVSRR